MTLSPPPPYLKHSSLCHSGRLLVLEGEETGRKCGVVLFRSASVPKPQSPRSERFGCQVFFLPGRSVFLCTEGVDGPSLWFLHVLLLLLHQEEGRPLESPAGGYGREASALGLLSSCLCLLRVSK